MLATTIAVSLAAVVWIQSLAYAWMFVEEIQITDIVFYEGQDTPFSGLPEVHITQTGQYIVVDGSSDIIITGSSCNVVVVGGTHNIQILGGYNTVTLLNTGNILIDVTNPDISLTQISGGWSLQAISPSGRPVIRGDIYLNSLGSPTNTVNIMQDQVIQCDSSYSGVAINVRNTGTCIVTIIDVKVQGIIGASGIPIPCELQPASEVSLSVPCTWLTSKVYWVLLFTQRGNMFMSYEIAW